MKLLRGVVSLAPIHYKSKKEHHKAIKCLNQILETELTRKFTQNCDHIICTPKYIGVCTSKYGCPPNSRFLF